MERKSTLLFLSSFIIVSVLSFLVGVHEAQLDNNYYQFSCPNLEDLVKKAILPIFLTDLRAPAAFLRLMFHDCQVQGCDASILLDNDGQNMDSEMISSRNFGIRNLESISRIKSVLEVECPGQVSCADIIVLAARESVFFSGGPQIRVPLGRRDSTTSNNKQADALLPSADVTVDEMLRIFGNKGMSVEESVAILGAHTLGSGHCINIVDRLYDPKATGNMDVGFETFLKVTCPTRIPLTNHTSIPNDLTPLKFDNQYYRKVMSGKGLFGIDSGISMDPQTSPTVRDFAIDKNYFFQVFSSAFVKLSSANVVTGGEGEIRRQCNLVN